MVDAMPKSGGEFFAFLLQDHARIESRLEALLRAVEPLRQPGQDASLALANAADTLAFFDREGARHERLEEQALFPRLRPLAQFRQILTALEFQHGMNRDAQRALAECCAGFSPARAQELRRLTIRFVEMHRGHAVAEERALFPLAISTLEPKAIAELERELQQR